MGVLKSHSLGAGQAIVDTWDIARGDTRRQTYQSGHDHHGGCELSAVARLPLEEKIINYVIERGK